jgi:hypothetical protein
MNQEDRIVDAKNLGIEDEDARALLHGTASWALAARTFAELVARQAASDPHAYEGFPPDTRTRGRLRPGGELVQIARSIVGMHGPVTPEEQLERRYLWDENTALGRLFSAYLNAAGIHGMAGLEFSEWLCSAIRDAAMLPEPTPLGHRG